MVPSRLATKPEIDIPGDKYDEIPPYPRVRWTETGVIENVIGLDKLPRIDNERYDTSKFTIVPGLSGVMHKDGTLMGVSTDLAVWRFGWSETSRFYRAFGCKFEGDGFLWVLATRKAGVIRETFEGFALHMPDNFRAVCDAAVVIKCGQGNQMQPEFFAPTTHFIRSNRARRSVA